MQPSFPQTSPWVLTVGATFVINNKNNCNKNNCNFTSPLCTKNSIHCVCGHDEHAVSSYYSNHNLVWTSGSGFSRYTNASTWHTKLVDQYFNNVSYCPKEIYFNRHNRPYPDIVALGRLCPVFNSTSGNVYYMDGTSCSAPVVAGMISQLNRYQLSKNKAKLGYVNPLFYHIFQNYPTAFNDITYGNSTCAAKKCCGENFGFIAKNGWDPVSGLGSLNIDKIKNYLP